MRLIKLTFGRDQVSIESCWREDSGKIDDSLKEELRIGEKPSATAKEKFLSDLTDVFTPRHFATLLHMARNQQKEHGAYGSNTLMDDLADSVCWESINKDSSVPKTLEKLFKNDGLIKWRGTEVWIQCDELEVGYDATYEEIVKHLRDKGNCKPGKEQGTSEKIWERNQDSPPVFRFLHNNRTTGSFLSIYVNGMALDHNDFHVVIDETRHPCMATTMRGYHPDDEIPAEASFEDHCRELAQFISFQAGKFKAKYVFAVGFSLGADMLMKIASDESHELDSLSGMICIDPNTTAKQTCFISRHFAGLEAEKDKNNLEILREIVNRDDIGSAQDFLDVSNYLVKVMSKLSSPEKKRALSKLAQEILEAYKPRTPKLLSKHFQAIVSSGKKIRCIFSNIEGNLQFKRWIEKQSWGKAAIERDSIRFDKSRGHFDFLKPWILGKIVNEFKLELKRNKKES